MEKTGTGINWLERIMQLVEKYSLRQFLKGFLIILLTAFLMWFITNPTWVFEKYQEWAEKQHTEKMEHRLVNNEKLHILAEKLLYKVNADRVVLLELHNGLSSNAGLPFAKCSATYEAINDGTVPVADQYQDVNLSLMPFANELFQNGYWCGDTNDLKEIDKALCYRMLGNDTSHLAGVVINGVDKPLAFLLVKFKSIDNEHNCAEIKKVINDNALQFALLLELNKEI